VSDSGLYTISALVVVAAQELVAASRGGWKAISVGSGDPD
jgi:hypothetical protein